MIAMYAVSMPQKPNHLPKSSCQRGRGLVAIAWIVPEAISPESVSMEVRIVISTARSRLLAEPKIRGADRFENDPPVRRHSPLMGWPHNFRHSGTRAHKAPKNAECQVADTAQRSLGDLCDVIL
jgi:hypothetical protein